MNLKEALKRIEELERRVKELESRKLMETHIHYHTHQQAPVPAYYQPIWQPINPSLPYEVTCGGVGSVS